MCSYISNRFFTSASHSPPFLIAQMFIRIIYFERKIKWNQPKVLKFGQNVNNNPSSCSTGNPRKNLFQFRRKGGIMVTVHGKLEVSDTTISQKGYKYEKDKTKSQEEKDSLYCIIYRGCTNDCR